MVVLGITDEMVGVFSKLFSFLVDTANECLLRLKNQKRNLKVYTLYFNKVPWGASIARHCHVMGHLDLKALLFSLRIYNISSEELTSSPAANLLADFTEKEPWPVVSVTNQFSQKDFINVAPLIFERTICIM